MRYRHTQAERTLTPAATREERLAVLLKESLNYSEHLNDCASDDDEPDERPDCDCGFDEWRERVTVVLGKEGRK